MPDILAGIKFDGLLEKGGRSKLVDFDPQNNDV